MENILTIKNLKTYYYSKNRVVPAVDGVDLYLKKGEILGVVGESGCGKSTLARSIIGLLDKLYTRIEDGEIIFYDKDLLKLSNKELNKIRGKKISMIFQDPLTTLNPVYTIGDQISEILTIHENISKKEAFEKAVELLKLVGIPAAEMRLSDYPHQLSGGMQQRVLIAIAIACNPEIIIADEPTTALDVTVQAQILELITQIKEKFGMGMILITHNMGVVAEMCNRIMVMYGGVTVEEGTAEDIFFSPHHPYTKGLLAAIPSIEKDKEELYPIKGNVPRFTHPVTSCRFADRCDYACEKCTASEPPLINIGEQHRVRCFLFQGNGDLS